MINRENVNELHGLSRTNCQGRRVITRGIKWEPFQNLMMGTDTCCMSNYAWGEALKSMNTNGVSQAIERIYKSGHGTPKNLQTDNGTEFLNSKFKVLMKSYR